MTEEQKPHRISTRRADRKTEKKFQEHTGEKKTDHDAQEMNTARIMRTRTKEEIRLF